MPPLRMLLVWDNLAGHKTAEMVVWLCRHGIMPLYTPLYDRGDVHAEVAARHLDTAVIMPPHPGAVPSDTAGTAPTRRDGHPRLVAERGRMGWQEASGPTCAPWSRPISPASSG